MTFILQLMWSTAMIHSPALWCDIIFSCWSSPAWIISASLCLFCHCHEDRVGQDLVPWMAALVLCRKVALNCSGGVCESTAASALQALSCAKLCTQDLMQTSISRKQVEKYVFVVFALTADWQWHKMGRQWETTFQSLYFRCINSKYSGKPTLLLAVWPAYTQKVSGDVWKGF